MSNESVRRLKFLSRLAIAIAVPGLVLGVVLFAPKADHGGAAVVAEPKISQREAAKFRPTAAQWATLEVQPVELAVFRREQLTEGKIAVDEDRSTPIFSPYAGRINKLLVAPGDAVAARQALFV